jgi:hypothetical protein
MTVQLFLCPIFALNITITTKFLSKHCIKRVLDTEMIAISLFQFYRKTFLRSVDPNQPKNVKFSL